MIGRLRPAAKEEGQPAGETAWSRSSSLPESVVYPAADSIRERLESQMRVEDDCMSGRRDF